MNEAQVQAFSQTHPCGDQQVGGLDHAFRGDFGKFFRQYNAVPLQLSTGIPVFNGQEFLPELLELVGADL
jgi:hypothetical protein